MIVNENMDNMAPDAGKYDNPYYVVIFIAVTPNGHEFTFLNSLNTRYDFWWERWGPWKKLLRPMTFHAFLVKGYKTNMSTGHGFTAVQHLCEFPGIDIARIFNKMYLEQWQRFHDSDEKTITRETEQFIKKLEEFNELQRPFIDAYADLAQEHFPTELAREDIEWALKAAEQEEPDWSIIIDTGDLIEQFMADTKLDEKP